MRIWRDDPDAVVANGEPVQNEIAFLLEGYINECIQVGPIELRDRWCSDGVVVLTITQPAENRINLLGVTYIGYEGGGAPFDIDLVLDANDDHRFAKTIFRIGTIDDQGRPALWDDHIHWAAMLNNRPRCDHDWAMAVELIPLEDE